MIKGPSDTDTGLRNLLLDNRRMEAQYGPIEIFSGFAGIPETVFTEGKDG
jgi:hypothetical protein